MDQLMLKGRSGDVTVTVTDGESPFTDATVTATLDGVTYTFEECEEGVYTFKKLPAATFEIAVIRNDQTFYTYYMTKDEWLDSEFNGILLEFTVSAISATGTVISGLTGEALEGMYPPCPRRGFSSPRRDGKLAAMRQAGRGSD